MAKSNFTPIQNASIHCLGLFVIGWSTMEGTLEVAIGKLLGLRPYDASVVTAGLQFKAKAITLRGLLNRDPKKHKEALEALGKIQNFSDRNDLLHGLAGMDYQGLNIMRRKSDGKLKSVKKQYSALRLTYISHQITHLAMQLQNALQISNDDYYTFFGTAHNEANKDGMSP